MTVTELRELLARLTNQDFKIRHRKYLNSSKIALIVSEDIQIHIKEEE